MHEDREQCWRDYAGWRVNYDTVLIALAALTMAPYAPWVVGPIDPGPAPTDRPHPPEEPGGPVMPDDDFEPIPVRRLDDEATAVELVDRGEPDDPLDEVLARLGAPLEEVMVTQRAVRKVRFDPVDDRIVLRAIELALKAPTGSNGQNWEFVVVKDRAVKAEFASVYRRAWRCTAGSGAGSCGATTPWRKVLDAVEWQVRALRGHPGAGRGLPARCAGPAPPAAADRQHQLLRVDLPERAEPAAGGAGDGSRRVAHHPAAALRGPHPPPPRACPCR